MLNFSQYLNESDGTASKLRGYPTNDIINRINGKIDPTTKEVIEKGLVHVFPDKLRFGIPPDNLGKAITYMDANGVTQKILNLTKYYSEKGEDIRFYCWSIEFDGSTEATEALRKKIAEYNGGKGFGDALNIRLDKVIEYFAENEEDSDNIASFSIGFEAPSTKREKQKLKSSQEESEQPKEI